ncbi:MAG: BNR-4 repeat-containing protein [Haloarculaceae archaeon]
MTRTATADTTGEQDTDNDSILPIDRRDYLRASGLLAGLGLTGASASTPATAATGEMFTETNETLLNGGTWAFNNSPWDQQKVITVGNYQYVPYWNHDGSLSLNRRNLTDDTIQNIHFDWTVPDEDSHRNTAIGIDNEGRLHLTYDHHDDPFRYRYSDPGFVTNPPSSISTSQFSGNTNMGLGGSEDPVTYPRFFNDQNGTLYCEYRIGASGNGDSYLHVHDAASNSWTRVGMVFSSAGTYDPWGGSTSRNAYHHDWTFDDNGRLHVTWTWRETWETWRSNHNIHYAYSDDGGYTWYNNDGTQIADVNAGDPIRVDDSGIVVRDAPVDSWLINQGTQALDSNNQPHIFTSRSTNTTTDFSNANRHYIHYWRTTDGQWHEQYIDDTSINLSEDTDIEPTRDTNILLNRDDLLFDANDNLHIYTAVDGRLYGAVATASSGWSDWTIYLLDEGPISGMDGRKHDEYRWEQDGVLSIPLERPNGGGGKELVMKEYQLQSTSAPAAPDLSVSSSSSSQVDLSWTGARGAVSYTIHRRPVGGSFSVVESGVAQNSFYTSYSDTSVSSGTDYEYRVEAVNSAGGTDSNIVSATTRGSSGPIAEGRYWIENVNSGKAMDVNNSSTSDGADVIQWGYWGGANQQWDVTQNSDGTYTITNVNSGKVLEVASAGTSDGDNVQQYTDNGCTCQNWNIIENSDGTYRLENANSGKVADVDGQSTSDGATVLQWGWWGGDNQKWVFNSV